MTVAFVTKTNHFQGEVYDHFTDNHIYMALATARYFDNPGTKQRLRAMGGTALFQFQVAHWGNEELPVYGQPYANLQALSDDPDEAKVTLDLALKLLDKKLENLQTSAGANGRVMIKWEPLGDVIGPVRQSLQRGRSMAGIALMVLLASVAVAFATRDRGADQHRPQPGRPTRATAGPPRRSRPPRVGAGTTI
ncbi:hypothetical protein Sme01_21670 [Sphaerisporangium melleum]|uniref:Uncharacterized protein n=1 Tax=Sphaerisporangium melleum TaxID=321316 RepID=A0A917R0D0_9ACTN|nr:hypothetical protein GCM10007964_22710 [Sphaerisporangium melleum]GII69691.1 hypothetical protein Sme01_21670 [Sphaerisporangium melleum]